MSALDQFCMTIKNDPKLMAVAPQLLAGRIQSGNAREALLALEVSWPTFLIRIRIVFTFFVEQALEECMETCGREFRSEINKFRFLNELIKLVSKKFEGDRTPREVSERVSLWSLQISATLPYTVPFADPKHSAHVDHEV